MNTLTSMMSRSRGEPPKSIDDFVDEALSSFDMAMYRFFGTCQRVCKLSEIASFDLSSSVGVRELPEEEDVFVYSVVPYMDRSRYYMDMEESVLIPYLSNGGQESVVYVPDGRRYRWSDTYVQVKSSTSELDMQFLALFLQWKMGTIDCMCDYDSRYKRTDVTIPVGGIKDIEVPSIDIETQKRMVSTREGLHRLRYAFADNLY